MKLGVMTTSGAAMGKGLPAAEALARIPSPHAVSPISGIGDRRQGGKQGRNGELIVVGVDRGR